MFFLPKVRGQLAAEIEAQFAAFAATGLKLDHVNAHKHFHLHPTIAGLMVKVGKRHGVKGARVPLEPQAVLAQIEQHRRSGTVALTAPFARALRSRFRRAGIAAPDQVFGLAWSGAMTAPRLRGLIEHLPEGLSRDLSASRHRRLIRVRRPGYAYARGTGGPDRSGHAGPDRGGRYSPWRLLRLSGTIGRSRGRLAARKFNHLRQFSMSSPAFAIPPDLTPRHRHLAGRRPDPLRHATSTSGCSARPCSTPSIPTAPRCWTGRSWARKRRSASPRCRSGTSRCRPKTAPA